MAAELQDEFSSLIKPRYDDTSAEDRAQLRALVAAMRPLIIERIVTAFQDALDREVQPAAKGGDSAEPNDGGWTL